MKKQQAFPNVTHYRDRHKKLRWRYRKAGFTVNLGTEYGSEEFILRYTAAVKGERFEQGQTAGKVLSGSTPGSLSHVIERWYLSGEFKRLGPTTQKAYRYISERLREEHGKKPIALLERRHIKAFMAQKADTPGAANNDLRIWRAVLDQAREDGLIPTNPAREIKKYTTGGDGHHTWTEDEIAAFYETHTEGTTAHLCMTLMLHTATSRADAVALGPANVKDGRLRYRRQKMKTRDGILVDIPLHPYLKQVLDALPAGCTTFLQTTQGKPRSANGMGTAMRAWCDAAGLPQCSSHGLRKACSRRLVEAGATPHEMMAVTGHKTLAEAQRYAETFERSGAADRAMLKRSTMADG
ncbi:tyrosine recombinase XerC [Blastomonas sp.]|uniref:site-specific integrase n=1 Tax=Blastomonas sp. TaxID=1909299 RepID=UPI0035930E81